MSPLMLKLRIFSQNWGSNMLRLAEGMLIAMESIETEPQVNADERRLIISAHRKGRKDREALQHSLHFYIEKHTRHRTRMTRIGRIFADNRIRGHPRHPRNLCSISLMEGKSGASSLDAGLGDR